MKSNQSNISELTNSDKAFTSVVKETKIYEGNKTLVHEVENENYVSSIKPIETTVRGGSTAQSNLKVDTEFMSFDDHINMLEIGKEIGDTEILDVGYSGSWADMPDVDHKDDNVIQPIVETNSHSVSTFLNGTDDLFTQVTNIITFPDCHPLSEEHDDGMNNLTKMNKVMKELVEEIPAGIFGVKEVRQVCIL